MNIAIVGHLKFPIRRPFAGGLEMFTYALVEALQQRGHAVTLFASGDSDPALPLSPICSAATIPDCMQKFGRLNHEWIESVEDDAYAELMRQLTQSKFDAVHNNSLSPVPLAYARSIPNGLITTLHAPVLPRMERELTLRGGAACGRFINISNVNALAWQHLVPEQTVIHNGVDVHLWRAPIKSTQSRAIWWGRILPDKGTHLAIDAAHEAGMPIDLAGPISDEDYFTTEVQPRLTDADRYLGHLTHEELCQQVSRAAVAVITPCWDEPFGLVVTEALACGTPVAGFARGALPELVTADVGRLAAPGDTHDLARAIAQATHLNRWRCRRVAEVKYSLDRMVSEYEAYYAASGVEVAA